MNMYNPKGLIQQKIEENNHISTLKQAIRSLYESYTIEHACFGLNESMVPCELENGYMESVAEYTDFNECLSNIKQTNHCIYIEQTPSKDENGKHFLKEKFVLGVFKPVISECDNSKTIIDLNSLEKINIE